MDTFEHSFLKVVEAGSFRKAAENLGIEPSSLSRKVAALEQRLTVKLLHRSTLKTYPTELGQIYYNGLRQIVDDQMALEEEIVSGVNTLKGILRIGSTVDLGEKFIAPVVREMQRQAPELSVELILGSTLDDLSEKNLDVAIRIGLLPDSNLVAKLLGEIPRILVASPEYLDVEGIPKTIEELNGHNFVLYSRAQAKFDIEFSDGTHFPSAKLHSNITANSARAMRALVVDGAGIHFGPAWLYKDDLNEGRVIQLLSSRSLKGLSVYVVYATRSFLPKKTKEFIERISEKIADQSNSIDL